MADELQFDIPQKSKFYADVVNILKNITGLRWGCKKTRNRIQYLSCIEIPVRIAVLWGKSYEKRLPYTLDIKINNKYPTRYESREIWEDSVGTELQVKLLKFLENSGTRTTKLIEKIKAWRCSTEYGNMILQADEQNRKHKIDKTKILTFDMWVDNCKQFGFG